MRKPCALVTGAAGMLGSAVVPALIRSGYAVVVTDVDTSDRRPWGREGPTLASLDVRIGPEVEDAVSQVQPDLVLHLAAETELEWCEEHPDAAFRTNAVGTKFVALACQRAGIPMVYISTAGVFDGTKVDPYTEFDEPNPINVYGRSKFEGERIVQQLVDRAYVIRAGWMVGGGIKDHKFVARVLQQLAEGRTTIHAVADKFGTPTYAPDFARCLMDLLASGTYGLYHTTCEGWGTRYDVAARILEILGRDDVELVRVSSDFFAEEFFAPRPRSEILRNFILDLQDMNTMRPWTEILEEYLRGWFPQHFREHAAATATVGPSEVVVASSQA